MASLVLKMSISLDGYVAPADGSSDWVAAGRSEDGARWTLETVGNAGTHLIGAATYARWAGFWPGAAGPFAQPMNEIPKVVFSDSLSSADWGPATIARGDLAVAVRPQARARRVPARPGGRAVRALAGPDWPDRRVSPRRPPGHPRRGRAALHHAADHRAREHHRLQPWSRRPRLRGAPVIATRTAARVP
jgi:RibD C-terminal domain